MTVKIYIIPWSSSVAQQLTMLKTLFADYNIKPEIIDCSLEENCLCLHEIKSFPMVRIYVFPEGHKCFPQDLIHEQQGNIIFSEIIDILEKNL